MLVFVDNNLIDVLLTDLYPQFMCLNIVYYVVCFIVMIIR